MRHAGQHDNLYSSGMTSAVTDPGTGDRYYVIGGVNYWSVTTALRIVAKENLPWWAAGLTASSVYAELPRIVASSRRRPCGNSTSRCKQGKGPNGHDWRVTCSTCPCGVCRECVERWLTTQHVALRDDRADEGSRVHDIIEHWVIGNGAIQPHENDIAGYVQAFLAFTTRYGLSPESWHFAEATIINRAEQYAGTTDGLVRFQCNTSAGAKVVAMVLGRPVSECKENHLHADILIDFKTKNKPAEAEARFYPDVALQLVAYRYAETVRIKQGDVEEPMPPIHATMVVQLRPAVALPRLTVSDEITYAAFLCALNLYRWRVELGSKSVSTSAFPLPPEPDVLPPKKTVKRAAKKQAPAAPVERELTLIPGGLAPGQPGATPRRPESPTMAALRRATAGTVHPDSPYGDDIPF